MSDAQAASELNRARMVIEIGAASLAAEYATDRQIQRLGQLIDDMAEALEKDDVQKYIETDMAFHLQLIKSTNQPVHHLFL